MLTPCRKSCLSPPVTLPPHSGCSSPGVPGGLHGDWAGTNSPAAAGDGFGLLTASPLLKSSTASSRGHHHPALEAATPTVGEQRAGCWSQFKTTLRNQPQSVPGVFPTLGGGWIPAHYLLPPLPHALPGVVPKTPHSPPRNLCEEAFISESVSRNQT